MWIIVSVVIIAALYAGVWVLKGKRNIYIGTTALVIGGTSGLGLALANDLRKRGATVTITSRDKKRLKPFEKEYQTLIADITDKKSISKITAEYNFVFCCPGFAIPSLASELTLEKIKQCMETNFYGTVRVILHFLNKASTKKRTRFVMISSTLGLHSFCGYGAYSPSKSALKSFYESIYMEASLFGLDLSIYYCSTIRSPGFEKEEKIKPEVTKKIEGQSYGPSSSPENRAKVLLDALPSQNIICSDFITRFFMQSTEITSFYDYLIWRVSPVFYYFFKKLSMHHVSRFFSNSRAPSSK
ncbi:3-dehydrosphinganine reductase [Nematocida sp. LUAm3]|nr:3-dehydrosphinganine reductase [Nematocida sp. LUAm3]KAI5175118.1 3-dehydrosphinganine reductase [Nematocida sp. LUAm2]KAI5178210.1 3-dehydrosphinganine reductase [Nematocida sp. LUAm1]